MNTTATSEPTPTAEVLMNRAAKEELLRQMYSRAHWIELIRLIGYQTVPMDKAREAIKPLAEQFGKNPMAHACEALVEIFTQDKEAFARLKPYVRRMAFQILGSEPAPDAVTPTAACMPSAPNQPEEEKPSRRAETKKAKKPPKAPPIAEDAVPPSPGTGDAIMQQYRAAKKKHPGMLIAFRLEDFFELFGDDAETAHKLLGLTLTTRDRTVTMAGFPHHQLEAYLHKLLQAGQRIAICEPVEDSSTRQEVTRVVTPSTVIEEGKSEAVQASEESEGAPTTETRPVRQPRHFVLKRFEAWLKETGLAFVAVEDVRRTTPAGAAYVGVLDFIILRGDEKLLVTVRPHLLAKQLKSVRELQNLFGSEYKPMRMWPSDGPDGWTWHDYAVDMSATNPADADRKPRRNRSHVSKPQ